MVLQRSYKYIRIPTIGRATMQAQEEPPLLGNDAIVVSPLQEIIENKDKGEKEGQLKVVQIKKCHKTQQKGESK